METQINTQPIPIIVNHYEVLNKLGVYEADICVLDSPRKKKVNGRGRKNNVFKTTHKILITGDSHAKGMVAELQHNPEDYTVQGLVTPGADLSAVLNPVPEDTKSIKK
jgi:hypothetical protein